MGHRLPGESHCLLVGLVLGPDQLRRQLVGANSARSSYAKGVEYLVTDSLSNDCADFKPFAAVAVFDNLKNVSFRWFQKKVYTLRSMEWTFLWRLPGNLTSW